MSASARKVRRGSAVTVITSLLLLHVVLLGYPFWRLGDWLSIADPLLWLGLTIIFSSQVICRWPLRRVESTFARRVKQSLELPLAISPMLLIGILMGESALALGFSSPDTIANLVLMLLLILTPLGIFVAHRPRVRTLNLRNHRLAQPLHLVQITDVHIGSRSPEFLDDLVRRINDLAPEALMITGDFIDQRGIDEVALAPLSSLNMPVFFVIGNHERYEDLSAIIERLEALGVKVLRNRQVVFRDDVKIIGVDDADDPHQLEKVLADIEIDEAGYNILLYHRPAGLEAAARRPVHLTLSGHTHNGQIFPFNLLVKWQFPKIQGLYKTLECDHYVSPGTGTWGPVFRLGSSSEITQIMVNP